MDWRERDRLMTDLRRDAARIADHFGLRLVSLEPERPGIKSRYGVCYSDGRIRIRLCHSRTGEPLKYSSLIDTLCHELAHLRHFNHGPEFKDFFWELLGWARREGIYRPTPRRQAADLAQISSDLDPAASRPMPSLFSPPQRDGVPVFAAPAHVSPAVNDAGEELLPWDRWQLVLARPAMARAARTLRAKDSSSSEAQDRSRIESPETSASENDEPSAASPQLGLFDP